MTGPESYVHAQLLRSCKLPALGAQLTYTNVISDAIGPIAVTYAPLQGYSVWNLSIYLSIILYFNAPVSVFRTRQSRNKLLLDF